MQNENINDKLLPYQVPHKMQIMECLIERNRVLDASDTGTGKTYVTLAVCKELGLKPFVICPKAVVPVWADVCKYFNLGYLGLSNYEMLKNCRYYTENFESTVCPYMDKELKKKPEKKKPEKKTLLEITREKRVAHFENSVDDIIEKIEEKNDEDDKGPIEKEKYDVEYIFYLPEDVIVIFDEAHRCKNLSSQTSKLLLGLSKCKNKIMILSATITDKIKCFQPFGIFFGFYSDTKQYRMWMNRELKINSVSKKFSVLDEDTQKLKIIHDKIFPNYGSRMKVKELIEAKLFPETQIQANCYYLENHIEIDKLYHEINDAVLTYAVKEMKAEMLARLIYCRQRMEMLKMPIIFDLIEEGLNDGYSVVVFVNYTESLNYICYHMKQLLEKTYNSKISTIVGGQSFEDREININEFQLNDTRLMISMCQAGGVGLSLHDVHKTHPRMAIISPTWSGDQIKQILGRVHRAGGTHSIQKLVYVAKTYEEKICELIKKKLSVIDSINDGDFSGAIINKEALELENMEKIDEVKKIKQFDKGEIVDDDEEIIVGSIETRMKKVNKKKIKKALRDNKNKL